MIKSSVIDKFTSRYTVEAGTGCWLWTGTIHRTGYGELVTKVNGRCVHTLAHRLAWQLFKGQLPSEMQVLHKCDVKRCVNPEHLFLGVHQDNMDDALSKGRFKSPRKQRSENLTAEQIEEIRASTESNQALALKYGKDRQHISRIRNQNR